VKNIKVAPAVGHLKFPALQNERAKTKPGAEKHQNPIWRPQLSCFCSLGQQVLSFRPFISSANVLKAAIILGQDLINR
jgi:hypothetical protein